METKVYKKVELENKQTLMILDLSRKIGEDAYLVLMKALIEIEIKKELFSDKLFTDKDMNDIKFDDILEVLGDKVNYEYEIERNFILSKDREAVFEGLVKTFMDNLGKYVEKPQFPGKLILKAYKDKTK